MPKSKHDKTDKTYYRAPPPIENVIRQLCDIANTVNALSSDYNAEIKGWWIWVDGDPVSSADESVLSNMGFFCSKSGKNAGKWYYKHPISKYYKHPISPNSRRRRLTPKPNKPKPKNAKHKPLTQLTERELLREELSRLDNLYQVDSGENHININKMIADVKVKIEQLGTHKPMPLQEFIDEHTEEDVQDKTEEKPVLTAAQLRDIFKK